MTTERRSWITKLLGHGGRGDGKPLKYPDDYVLCGGTVLDGSGRQCGHPLACMCHGPMFGCSGFVATGAMWDGKGYELGAPAGALTGVGPTDGTAGGGQA